MLDNGGGAGAMTNESKELQQSQALSELPASKSLVASELPGAETGPAEMDGR